jgi:AraC family transcriptional regulator
MEKDLISNVCSLILQFMYELLLSNDPVTEQAGIPTPALMDLSRQIPGSVQYRIRRFARPAEWKQEDAGLFRYNFVSSQAASNHVELRFCITGNMYCRLNKEQCSSCMGSKSVKCSAKTETVDYLSFVFSSTLLEQFVKSRMADNSESDDVLSFSLQSSFVRTVSVCNRTRMVLEGLLNHNYSDSLENIYVNAQTQMLLLYSLDGMDEKQIDVINCKFLANEPDREKVMLAREILIKQIGEPITIKDLSRKVAMNECYLKKGFKELFGSTIFDFYQSQRMEHAKFLLYEKGLTVTDVSATLGYSSISHFSTAFKKHTGLKPCELLLRN